MSPSKMMFPFGSEESDTAMRRPERVRAHLIGAPQSRQWERFFPRLDMIRPAFRFELSELMEFIVAIPTRHCLHHWLSSLETI